MCVLAKEEEHEPALFARGHRQWAIVLPVIFLEFLVITGSRAIIPGLIDDHYGPSSYIVYGSADGARGLLAFLATPALGALSDVLGRKWLFLVTVVGTSSPIMALAFAENLDVHLAVWALSGLTAATFPLAFAYISDLVPAPALARAFGVVLGVGLGLAMVLGPISGALLARARGTAAVFELSVLITMANAVLTAGCMREARGAGARRHRACYEYEGRAELRRRANPCAAFAVLAHHAPLRLLSALVFFFYLSLWGFIANNLLYCKRRFGFTPVMSAGLLTTFGLVTALAQSFGLRLAQRHLTEPQIVRACFLSATLALVLYGVAWQAWPLYVAMVLLGISVGGFACVSSLASQVVPAHVVGEAQGLLTSMKALTEGFGPLLVSLLLHAFEGSVLPGAPWLLCGACAAVAALLGRRLESTIAAHATSSTAHTQRYAPGPAVASSVAGDGLGRVEGEGGGELQRLGECDSPVGSPALHHHESSSEGLVARGAEASHTRAAEGVPPTTGAV